MKKLPVAALAALALAATLPLPVQADDPVTPVQGAVCNLYLFGEVYDARKSAEITASIAEKPAAATFVDSAAEFKAKKKNNNVESNWGMWTGWLKQEKAGTYTFTCTMNAYQMQNSYSIWINGQKALANVAGQNSFDVELAAGFNSVKIVVHDDSSNDAHPLTINYKKKGSVKDPVSFGPENMFYDDEEE